MPERCATNFDATSISKQLSAALGEAQVSDPGVGFRNRDRSPGSVTRVACGCRQFLKVQPMSLPYSRGPDLDFSYGDELVWACDDDLLPPSL